MATVVSSWNSSQPVSRQHLIDRVSRLYGFDSADSELAQVCLDALDDTIDDMNMALFDFNKLGESGIPLVEGQPWVLLTSQFYRESQAYLVNSNGAMQDPLDHLPWSTYQRWYGDSTITGTPEKYSLFNFEKEGKLYFYPTPDANAASAMTLTVEFYRRIPLVSELGISDSLDAPREVQSALVYGAQKRIALHLGQSNDIATLAGLEMQALERLKRVDKTHPDERKRFMLADFAKNSARRRRTTDVYIKL